MDHSANLSMLEVKQQVIEELTKRCSKMSIAITELKKVIENVSELEVKFAESLLHPFHMHHFTYYVIHQAATVCKQEFDDCSWQ